MKFKPYNIIFFLLLFLSSFFITINFGLALTHPCTGVNCPSNSHCEIDSGCVLNSESVTTCQEIGCVSGDECVMQNNNAICINESSFKKNSNVNPTNISFTPQVPFGKTITGNEIKNGSGIAMYITNVYNYAVGIVGILAAIVMMWGGVRWLTAGGNQEAVSDAKKWIEGALSGLVLVMTSYMVLYFVNPDLTTFKLIKITPITGGSSAATGAAGSAKVETDIKGNTCDSFVTYENAINFTPNKPLDLNSRCNSPEFDSYFQDAATKNNVSKQLLKAIAMAESSCNQNATNPSGACGIMQMMGGTSGMSCAEAQQHPKELINAAAEYLAKHKDLDQNDKIAGYNTGYGITSVNNKKAALARSDDCPDRKAYECCINPGGLKDTQKYVRDVNRYLIAGNNK